MNKLALLLFSAVSAVVMAAGSAQAADFGADRHAVFVWL